MESIHKNVEGNNEKNFNKNKSKKEKDIKTYKKIIFRLQKQKRIEKRPYKKREIDIELKETLKKALEITPEDVELKIALMYIYIDLRELENARKIGNTLFGQTEAKGYLNALSLIEEKSGNYDKAIEYVQKMLEKEPKNQALQDRLEIMEDKKENKPIREDLLEKKRAYKQIASLERSVIRETEEQQGILERRGELSNRNEILQKNYKRIYGQIRKIAEEIIKKHPEEIVAREKLIKSLYYIGESEQAREEIGKILKLYNRDEVALWYLSKIQRDNGELEGEKETLENILENSEPGTNIKVQKRLENVKHMIEKKEEKKRLEELKKDTYTEERRKEFIQDLQKDFVQGNITKQDIKSQIENARKYPNFDKSLLELLEMESLMTGDKREKIEKLENYIDTEPTLTPETYNNILDEISRSRQKIEEDKKIEDYLDKKDQEEEQNRQERVKEQREYSREIIKRLNKGDITKKELPKIVSKLETFDDVGKSVFLITKLYEILYDRNKAYESLGKYTSLLRLTSRQRKQIVDLQERLTESKKQTGSTARIKGVYEKKNQKEERYHKKIQKGKIVKALENGKTVKQILQTEKGISLKTIMKIKNTQIKKNPELQQEYANLEEDATILIKGGYKPKEVYELMEYDIPFSRIREISKALKEHEIEI